MSSTVFSQIKELKLQGRYVDAWNLGYQAFQNEPQNTYLRTSLFWVCYAAIKSIQEPILNRQNKAPNPQEQQTVNGWINCISYLNLPMPSEELDFRFFNLFKGCGQHYETYVQMILFYGTNLFKQDDLLPYKTEKGEVPSLVVKLVRQVAKGWMMHHQHWQLNFDGVLSLLQFAMDHAKDKNKIWLHFDKSKCLVLAGRYDQAREEALLVLNKKKSESWAWGALADTYFHSDKEAAIACYAKGIMEAHEPAFSIPMYFSLAQLLAQKNNFNLASASVSKLIEVYQTHGWKLKSEHEDLVQQTWFDASVLEGLNFDQEVKKLAKKAQEYVYGETNLTVGIVDSHHRSGKGFSVYIDVNKRYNARGGLFFGKGLPKVGTWVEVKYAINNGVEEVIEVHSIEPQTSDKVQNDSGVLKKADKGFGFVNDAFIPPYLLHEVSDGEQIKVVKIWDIAPKKTSPSWRVIIVEKS